VLFSNLSRRRAAIEFRGRRPQSTTDGPVSDYTAYGDPKTGRPSHPG